MANEYDALAASNEYDSLLAEDAGREKLRASMVPALESVPDQAAEAVKLGKVVGVPAPVVERNLDTVRKQVQVTEYDKLLGTSPALAKHLSDKPDFARIAHDDTESLGAVERVTRGFRRGFQGTMRGIDAQVMRESAEILNLAQRLRAGEFGTEGDNGEALMRSGSPYAFMFQNASADMVNEIVAGQEEAFADAAVQFALRSGRIAGLPASPEYREMQDAEGWLNTLGAFFKNPIDISTEIVGESLGALAPTLPLILAGGGIGGAGGLAATTGFSSSFTEFSNSLPAIFAELGVDMNDRAAVQATIETPEFKQRVRQSLVKAGIIGAFDAATAGLSAVRMRPSAAGNLAAQTGVQSAGGAAGEATGSVASGQEVDPASVIAEAVGEIPTAAIDAGVLAARNHAQKQQAAQAAEQDAEALAELAELGKASKVAQRDLDSFQAFVDAAAAEGPVQDVYVEAKVLAETLQQDGLAEFAQAAPSAAAQIPEALASGGTVRIPLGEYAAGLAASGLNTKLLPHLKTDPAGMSQVEAQEYMQGAAEQFKAEAEQILAQKQADDAFVQSAAKVEGTILEQLTAANRFTPDVNKAYAALTRDFYVTTAARVGVTPEELYARYPLKVQAEGVAGEEALGQGGQWPDLAELLAQYDEQDGSEAFPWMTERDLLESAAFLMEDGRAPPELADAFRSYKEALREDFEEHAGRGDVESPQDALIEALRRAVASAPLKQSATPAWPDLNAAAVEHSDDPRALLAATQALIDDGRAPQILQSPAEALAAALDDPAGDTEAAEAAFAQAISEAVRETKRGAEGPAPTETLNEAMSRAFNIPPTYGQDARPTFYSGLQRAVEGVKQGKAPAAQWMGMLKNQPGVKAEELEWTGLEEWLAQQEGSVSKEAVLEFLRANEIEVQEVVKGAEREAPDAEVIAERLVDLDNLLRANRRKQEPLTEELNKSLDLRGIAGTDRANLPWWIREAHDLMEVPMMSPEEADNRREHARQEIKRLNIPQATLDRMVELAKLEAEEVKIEKEAQALRREQAVDATATTFEQYTLPGAKEGSYRELLLTLPVEARGTNRYEARPLGDQGSWQVWDTQENKQKAITTQRGAFEEAERMNRAAAGTSVFKSGHFSEPNILAHVRFNERTDADGKRVLFIEEVQSDWHQKGRREGYQTKPPLAELLFEDLRVAEDEHSWVVSAPDGRKVEVGKGVVASEGEARDYAQRYLNAQAREKNREATLSGVPDAPFKTTWPMLVMKRMLRWAVDNGYDRIAWTTGEQQADRYDLSKQINKIQYTKNDDGTFDVYPFPIDQHGASLESLVQRGKRPDQLADFVGKELADKIARGEGVKTGRVTTLSGLDLKVGGEGMAAFYDKMLPAEMNRYTKKWGGKVGQTVIGHDRFKVKQDDDGSWYYEDEGKSGEGGFPTRTDAELAARADNEREDRHTVHSLDITPAMREAALAGQPLFQGAANQPSRGSFAPGTNTITLLKNADLSTFLHESGHFYLEVLADLAAQPGSPVADDMAKVLAWFGVKDLATWQAMSLEQKRPHHEKFARGFERYLFENDAPSVELKGLFARFRSWLVNVYKTLTALNVELSDEVRGVFDRMLASEQQIQAAESAAGIAPLFESAEQIGMKPEEWASYQALGAQASQDALDDLQRRSLRDMQWLTNARGRALKALQRDAAEKRKAVRKEAAEEVGQQRVYAAMRFLKTGELPDGRTWDGPHKLQVSAIEEMYPAEQAGPSPIDRIEAGELYIDMRKGLRIAKVGEEYRVSPAGKADFKPYKADRAQMRQLVGDDAPRWQQLGRLTAVKGITPDAASELLGFTSGDHLIRELLAAQPQEEVVEALTDQRMLERYGDLADPDALQRAANEAVHNDARMRFVATELNALAKATGGRKVLAKAAKDFAAAIVARKRVRDIKPAQYTTAEARAARNAEAALKAGNLTEAAVEKRNQLVNGYASRAAHEAVDEIDKGVRYLRKFAGPTSLDPGYAEQIHALLARFDLRRITNREADRRATLAKWADAQRELGFEPAIDEALLDEAARKPYREMTLEEFRGLIDTVRNIEHLGRLKRKLLTAQDEREFAEAVQTAADSIRANAKGKKPAKLESNTALDRAAEGVGEFFAMHRKVASLVREMDGSKDGGVLWELLLRPLNAAGNAEAVAREKATMALDKLFKESVTKGLRTKLYIPEIGTSLSKEGRLAVALNWGNADNRQRVMDGDGWTPDQVLAILNTLTKPEWEFVQGVWDYVDTYWDEIAAKEKRVSGITPEKVQPLAIETRFGTFRGGYYPIKYDPNRSSKAEAHTLAEAVKQSMQGLFTRATTRRGHTKARVEEVTGRPVRKDLGVVFEHVTQVVHDLKFHEYLIDANRLLRASAIDAAIREHYGPEVLRQLRNALNDIAAGDVPAQNTFERAVNHVRTGATIAGMGWNLTTALIQPLGLTQSMVRIGPKWVGRGMARWLRDAASFENTAAWIDGKSDFMRLRGKTLQREINEIRNKVSGKTSAIEASYFYLIQQMQRTVDIPTWLGAYEKAMADPANDEARAIALADQAVLDSQGGGQVKDLAAIQRGGPLMKLWTNFYSYFNVTYNLAAERTRATKFSDPLQVGRLAVDYLLLFTLPAVLGAVIRTALKPGEDWDDLPEKAAREQLNYLFGLFVGLRELGSAINGFAGYTGPAGLRFFSEVSKLVRQTEQGEVDEALLKSLNNAGGILLHYPAGQVQRTVEGTAALIEGDTANPLAVVTGAPR